jgi:hypothetical protein
MQSYPFVVVYPSHREFFPHNKINDHTRQLSSFLGFGVILSLDFSHLYFGSCHIIA